jgi:predicted DsbA family dithiol-disulfide isomerase
VDAPLRIDVFSDVVCPWCFLGKRRLDAALAGLASDGHGWANDVEVHWRAFRLDPSATTQPADLRAAIERKYGPGSFDAMTGRFDYLGPPAGISYRFDLAVRVGTTDAHRLLAWALATAGPAAQHRLADELFSAYFERGANIADANALTAAAAASDLDATEAAIVLETSDFADAVAADLAEAAARDIHAVPTMLVAGRLAVPGAQEVETLRAVLLRAHQRFA